MKKMAWCFVTLLVIAACRNKNKAVTGADSQPGTDTSSIYDLTTFFNSQLQYASALKTPVYKISEVDTKKDSVTLTQEQLKEWMHFFTEKNIATPALRPLYRETVFQDLTTKSYTINYTSINPDAVIRSIDILLDQESSQVKRVFIRSNYRKGDTLVTEHANWKAFSSFTVNRYMTAGTYTHTELNYINWNNDTSAQ